MIACPECGGADWLIQQRAFRIHNGRERKAGFYCVCPNCGVPAIVDTTARVPRWFRKQESPPNGPAPPLERKRPMTPLEAEKDLKWRKR